MISDYLKNIITKLFKTYEFLTSGNLDSIFEEYSIPYKMVPWNEIL